jgi:hypothetical protein
MLHVFDSDGNPYFTKKSCPFGRISTSLKITLLYFRPDLIVSNVSYATFTFTYQTFSIYYELSLSLSLSLFYFFN